MIADIGTRNGSKLVDLDQESLWINRFNWMKGDKSTFPVMSVDQLSLSNEEIKEIKKEIPFHRDIDQQYIAVVWQRRMNLVK